MKKDWVMLFFAIMFSSVMWPMAVWFSYNWARQAQTTSWLAADEAVVVNSRVASHRGGKSTTYRPEVEYRYRVGEHWHTGERLGFGTGYGDSSGGYAQAVVSAHPAGAKVTVYVDPSDPTRAVLFKGLQDRDWKTLAFISPLAVVPMLLWGAYIGSEIRRGRGYVGTVRVFEPAPGVSVFRDMAFGPWSFGLGALLAGAIATALLVVALVYTNVRETLFLCWGITLALSVASWLGRRRWINAGRKDGVIDLNAGTLSFARGRKRGPESVELTRIVGTTLKQDSNAATNKRPHWRVHVRVEGIDKTRPIADIQSKADARDFENWVRERIALPAEPAVSRKRRKRKDPPEDDAD